MISIALIVVHKVLSSTMMITHAEIVILNYARLVQEVKQVNVPAVWMVLH